MLRALCLIALLSPRLIYAQEDYPSLRAFVQSKQFSPNAYVACASFPEMNKCDPNSEKLPTKNQMVMMFVGRSSESDRNGQLFFLQENQDKFNLKDSSGLLYVDSAKSMGGGDLEFKSSSRFRIQFCEYSRHYCERYTFEKLKHSWRVALLEIRQLGTVTDPKSGESFTDETRIYSMNFKTGKSIDRRRSESETWLPVIYKKHHSPEITFANFTLDHGFK